MRRIVLSCLVLLLADFPSGLFAQGYPGGGIPPITGGAGRGGQQQSEVPSAPAEVKPLVFVLKRADVLLEERRVGRRDALDRCPLVAILRGVTPREVVDIPRPTVQLRQTISSRIMPRSLHWRPPRRDGDEGPWTPMRQFGL